MKQLLYAESVSKKIGSKQILQNISLNLSGGNVYGFVGENGSGKTMLFRILSGLVKPTTGKVCLNRTDIHKGRCSERIGVIIENSCMWPELTGWENLLFLGSLNKRISKADIRTTLERVGLDPTNPLPIKKYSLGMRQRLIVAQAIMEKPNFLFLDEPTNAIDKEGVLLIRDIIFGYIKTDHTDTLTLEGNYRDYNFSDLANYEFFSTSESVTKTLNYIRSELLKKFT